MDDGDDGNNNNNNNNNNVLHVRDTVPLFAFYKIDYLQAVSLILKILNNFWCTLWSSGFSMKHAFSLNLPYIHSESVNPDIVYPTNPLSDTLLPVTDLVPLLITL